jgi:Outer membrane lipoprotein-sorting protein
MIRIGNRHLLLAIAVNVFGAAGVLALDASTTDPRAIVMAASARPLGDRAVSRMKMTIKDGSGARERIMTLRSRNLAQGSRTLIRIEEPAEARNNAFLSVDYTDRTKEDEQWLYLPNLRRVTRVPSSGRSGAFLGSDFSYIDLSRQDFADYEVKLIEASAKVDSEDCWVIEAAPKTPALQEQSGYLKTQLWISKSKLMAMQFKSWVVKGHKIKYVKVADVRKVDGIWTPYQMQARTISGSHVDSETTLEVLSMKYGSQEVTDDDLTVQRLAPGG